MPFEPTHICESSLSRLVGLASAGPFAIVTAFRKEFTVPENKARNQQLISWLNGHGMGPHLLVGHWMERPKELEHLSYEAVEAMGKLIPVTEHSCFVPKPSAVTLDDFRALMVAAMNSYNQDAIIFGADKGNVMLLFHGGGSSQFGKGMTVSKLGKMYSHMQKGKAPVPFVFEGAAQPVNVISRLAFNVSGIHWLPEAEAVGPRCRTCEGVR